LKAHAKRKRLRRASLPWRNLPPDQGRRLALPCFRFIVWWGENFLSDEDQVVRELVAAFERKTGKPVEPVQYSHEPQVRFLQQPTPECPSR
jgi:hypothetical protein